MSTWIDVEGTKNMPIGDWIVVMEDGKYGMCQIAQGANSTIGIINGKFYFDVAPVVAYMPIAEYVPKGGVS